TSMRHVLPILRVVLLLAVVMACMLGGILAAAGACALVYGPAVLDTALGDPPDRSHPAFWLFLVIMVPAMLVGAAGALFGVVLPVAATWKVAGVPGSPLARRLLRAYLSHLGRLVPGGAAR